MVAAERHIYSKWMILTASFLNMFLCAGFPFNMSVVNVEFLNAFGKSQAETALVQSVNIGLLLSTGVISGQGVNKFGVRIMGICGGLVSSLGLILSAFATSIPFLIVTMGVVTGLGLSAAFVSATTIVGIYFEGRSKFIAVSFVYFGAGCGGMAYPFLFDILIQTYGWRGCLLITGGLTANMVCFFAVCKPLPLHKPRCKLLTVHESSGTTDTPTCADEMREHLNDGTVESHSPDTEFIPIDNRFTKTMRTIIHNYTFLIVIIATALSISAFNSPLIFLNDYLTTKGFDDKTALLLYFYMTLSNSFGRLAPGICKNIPHVGVLIIPAFFSGVGAVVNVAILRATTYTHHVIALLAYGAATGSNVASMSVTSLALVGVENYSVGFGVLITTVGISNVCAGPIAGWLQDITGTYSASFYTAAAAQGAASGLYILAATLRKCKRNLPR